MERSIAASRGVLLAILLLACQSASTARAAGLHTRLSRVDSSEFPTVSVVLQVFTEKGSPVMGLSKDAFTLTEDGTAVQLLEVKVDEAPLTMALVLDTSGSMAPAMNELKKSVAAFVRELHEKDGILLIPFGDRPYGGREVTLDRRKVLDQVKNLEPEGATALYDATARAIKGLKDEEGMRIAVIFTDGKDQNADGSDLQSSVSVKSVVHDARSHGIQLWTIGLGSGVDHKLLGQMSQLTGGRSYRPSKTAELRTAFSSVLRDVRLRYRLTYSTPKAQRDGSERKLAVTSEVQGSKGQGAGTYRAPVEKSVASPEAPVEPTEIEVENQACRATFQGAAMMDTLLAWPTSNATPASKDAEGVVAELAVADSSLILPPGAWSFGFQNGNPLCPMGWLASAELRPGDQVILRLPGATIETDGLDPDARVLTPGTGRVRFKGSWAFLSNALVWPASLPTPTDSSAPGVLRSGYAQGEMEFILEPGDWVFGYASPSGQVTVLAQGTVHPDELIVVAVPKYPGSR